MKIHIEWEQVLGAFYPTIKQLPIPITWLQPSHQLPNWLTQKCDYCNENVSFILFNHITCMHASLIYSNFNIWLMLLYFIFWFHFGIQDTVIHFVITRQAALVNVFWLIHGITYLLVHFLPLSMSSQLHIILDHFCHFHH
jgi:hypothetical protein